MSVSSIDTQLLTVCLPQDGWTPLLNAAYRDNIEIVRLLLNNGASPEAATKAT